MPGSLLRQPHTHNHGLPPLNRDIFEHDYWQILNLAKLFHIESL